MNLLLVHNRYRYCGGEDTVVVRERDLLINRNNQVIEYLRNNGQILQCGLLSKASLARGTVWAGDTYAELCALFQHRKFDLVHFHNTLPLISPAAYYACRRADVPVVQTLHNYRLLCPKADFFHGNTICEQCAHGLWNGIRQGCYRQSVLATATVAAMIAAHRWLGTWRRMVDCYIVPSVFARRKFIEGGLPAGKIAVKPNFVHPDPYPDGVPHGKERQYALFIGRLSKEKGLETLITAWSRLSSKIPLVIIGDGPLKSSLESRTARLRCRNIAFAGYLDHRQLPAMLERARFLIVPSECYETFGLVAVEAFACGVPVLASRLGAMEELVKNEHTGLTFSPGNPNELATVADWAWTHPQRMEEMGREARTEYKTKYTADSNYATLMNIYEGITRAHPSNQESLTMPSVC